jgi:hypothetical protein
MSKTSVRIESTRVSGSLEALTAEVKAVVRVVRLPGVKGPTADRSMLVRD